MPKKNTIVVFKYTTGTWNFERSEDYALYTQHKAASKELLADKPAGLYEITIVRRYFGLYYIYTIREIFSAPTF